MRHKALFALLFYTLVGTAGAATDDEIRQCATISNAAERLFCFDSLAASLRTETTPAAAAPVPARKIENRETGGGNSAAAARPTANDDFGLEVQKAREGASSIKSRYKGNFKGWDGDTVFELENGQVWQQSDSGRMVMSAENPMITITRGWLGSYYLRVEGYNKRIRVKRIK